MDIRFFEDGAPYDGHGPRHRVHGKGAKIFKDCVEQGEPFVVFRAKDIFTPMVIANYMKLLEDYCPEDWGMQESLVECRDMVKQWQKQNMEKVRYPD